MLLDQIIDKADVELLQAADVPSSNGHINLKTEIK
jgi:hypothetical protein